MHDALCVFAQVILKCWDAGDLDAGKLPITYPDGLLKYVQQVTQPATPSSIHELEADICGNSNPWRGLVCLWNDPAQCPSIHPPVLDGVCFALQEYARLKSIQAKLIGVPHKPHSRL